MKKKIFLALLILICLCSLTVFTACESILDFIFGPPTPSNPDDVNKPHVHNMQTQTFSGSICTGQEQVTYYKCSGCGKSFIDKEGNEEFDATLLQAGHLYVLKSTDNQHFRQCALCNEEQENSRGEHYSNRWKYNAEHHYKLCEVCNAVFDEGEHSAELSCDICGRKADYKTMCNSRYGYESLTAFENSVNMQKLYNKIDTEVQSAHDDKNRNFNTVTLAQGDSDYALSVNSLDYRVTPEEAFTVVAAYRNDNPLYYWIGTRVGMITRTGASQTQLADTINICVDGNYSLGSKRVAANNSIYSEIDSYVSDISDENDPYYISLALHDKIINNINYAYKDDGSTPQDEAWAHGITGVFLRDYAVCEGYAKAFQLLLNVFDVNNVYVTGTSRGEGHAWNMVQMSDGKWYWYDLTWDDQPALTRGISYEYFCKADGEFDSHTVSTEKIGINYMYDLPVAATEVYKSDCLTLNETFTDGNFTYQLVGYNRLSVIKCVTVGADGIAEIPETAAKNNKNFKVAQIDSEAFATYTYDNSGNIVSILHPTVKKVVIPSTVDLIFNKSFCDCKTLIKAEFVDKVGWSRYGLTGKAPEYEQISADKLTNEMTACSMLKELYKGSIIINYYCVWVKSVAE